ncbi:MAG: VWA domain-containing protein [Chitinophagaceae bacterium]|nr:MAG: VWA domain-containing protein [Chitinophagaceae bacterium]
MTRHQVHNLIILDESGSMQSIRQPTLQGFNEIVQTIKGVEAQFPDQQHFISLVSFNGLGRKVHLWKAAVKDLNALNARTYCPDASTPLYDAMGISMARLSAELAGEQNYNVLVTIFTDGEENASVEFSGEAVRKMVTQLKQLRWTFTYIGTDHDVTQVAINLNISNVMAFEKNETDMSRMFTAERSARMRYSRKIDANEATNANFYEPGKEE